MEFNVTITDNGFIERFLNHINLGRRGSFQGKEYAEEALAKLKLVSDFQTEIGIKKYLINIIELLTKDVRRENEDVLVRHQLKKGFSVEELYKYIFGLSYLEPKYVLRWEGKELERLSPGERGTLLLIFYLLIDSSEIPLVIDQPEGNLDNNTVAEVLIHCVREAKERRQVFLVTHNPNLAVACDAEQIVYAKLEKDNKHTLTYTTGSLEDTRICEEVVKTLEGNKFVFYLRDYKYKITEA